MFKISRLKAPGYDRERRRLAQMIEPNSKVVEGLEIEMLLPAADDLVLQEVFLREVERLRDSQDVGEKELLEAIEGEFRLAIEPENAEVATLSRVDWLEGKRGAIGRYVNWVWKLTKYRADLIFEIDRLYGPGEGLIDLYTPALVDYDHWINGEVGTSLEQQVELMGMTSRAFKGRVHGFVAFDP